MIPKLVWNKLMLRTLVFVCCFSDFLVNGSLSAEPYFDTINATCRLHCDVYEKVGTTRLLSNF